MWGRKREPVRPVCAECGAILDPKKACSLPVAKIPVRWIGNWHLLAGLYCCADYLLDAYTRGYARGKIRGGP